MRNFIHCFFFSGSPFSKPTVLSARCNASPYGSAATTSSSAFSSVVSPSTARRTSSPSTVATAFVGVSSSAGSELEKRSHVFAGSSKLYPWLKSEAKEASGERRDRAEGEPERSAVTKSEAQRRSPAKNLTMQALEGDRPETLRPRSLGAHDSSGFHAPREPRPLETRQSYPGNSHLSPLNTFDKRPFDYRASVGSIDLNRNTLYSRLDPMMAVHSPHVTSLNPHIGLGYVYPGAPFVADSAMYHSPLGHGMFLGGHHDPMSSLAARSQDVAGFYRRRENIDERVSDR